MKKKLSLILVMVLLAFSVVNSQEKTYDVNFKNISMKEFISFVSSFTGINIVYSDGDLRGTVSITSQYPMTSQEILEIFNSTLASNGLNPVEESGFIRIIPDKDLVNYNDRLVVTEEEFSDDDFVTSIIILKSYNAPSLASSLSRVKSKHGAIEPLRGINGLLIRDFGSNIEKMKELSVFMDKASSVYQLYSVNLENIQASKMEQYIMRVFSELFHNSLSSILPIVISDDNSNVLIFVTDKSGYEKINYLISSLDIKNRSLGSQPRIYYLKHAKAEDLDKVLNKLLTTISGTSDDKPSFKSNVSYDKSTNSIIALGSQDFYSNLESIIERLDIPRRQVFVEALILETSLDNNEEFGVEWFVGGNFGDDYLGFGGSNTMGLARSLLTPSGGIVNPISALPGGFTAGVIGNTITYNGIQFPTLGAFLKALRNDNQVNIISNPQILTLDNEEAEVFVGENRPYITSEKVDNNNNPIQTFEYKNVGIRLKVTPHIAGDDLVQLDIEQEVDKVSASTFRTVAPVTLKRTTKTKVQLYDGSIMIISGLMKDDALTTEKAVPVLGSIPLIGWLFKSKSVLHEKTNMMIFVTTYIIREHEDMETITRKRYSDSLNFQKTFGNESSGIIPMQENLDSLLIPNLE